MNRDKQINKIYRSIRNLEEFRDGANCRPSFVDKQVNIIKTTIDSTLPEYLYKYRDTKPLHIDSLKEEKLYLSKPSAFNDPTESIAYVDTNTMLEYAFSFPDCAKVFDSFEIGDDPIGNLVKRTELMNVGLEYIKLNRERVKILCLSEVIDSPLMWSHYASEHRGFAIRFRSDTIDIPECNDCNNKICRRPGKPIFPVIYKDSRYDASIMAMTRAVYLKLNGDIDDQLYPFPLLVVLQKNSAWSYEKEWRFVCDNTESTYFTLKPDAIFLGERIETPIALELSHIAKEKKIGLYKMEIDYFDKEFKLLYSDWSDYSDEDIKQNVLDK